MTAVVHELDLQGPAAPPRANGELVFEQPWQGRAFGLADKVIVAIGVHPAKKSLFTFEERKAVLVKSANTAFGDLANVMSVISFSGLVVEAAKLHGATFFRFFTVAEFVRIQGFRKPSP